MYVDYILSFLLWLVVVLTVITATITGVNFNLSDISGWDISCFWQSSFCDYSNQTPADDCKL